MVRFSLREVTTMWSTVGSTCSASSSVLWTLRTLSCTYTDGCFDLISARTAGASMSNDSGSGEPATRAMARWTKRNHTAAVKVSYSSSRLEIRTTHQTNLILLFKRLWLGALGNLVY